MNVFTSADDRTNHPNPGRPILKFARCASTSRQFFYTGKNFAIKVHANCALIIAKKSIKNLLMGGAGATCTFF